VNKQKKTAAELEEIVKQRIGAGDFKVTVHANPETGWHATIYGRQLHDPRTSDALSRRSGPAHQYARGDAEVAARSARDIRIPACRIQPRSVSRETLRS
jgi:hypothetical protein